MQVLTVLICSILVQQIFSGRATNQRIIGGSLAKLGQFKHQVSLQSNGEHFCGGSIISPTAILTAAHCVYNNKNKINVVAGITKLGDKGAISAVSKILYHGSFDSNKLLYDVAVLKLSTPLPLSGNIQAVQLRSKGPGANEAFTLSGWGLTSYPSGQTPKDLHWIQVKSIDLKTCAKDLNGSKPITDGHICTASPKGQGSCQGDSGGPLVDSSGKQIGIVSWGIPCATGQPDVFSSVPFYLKWINDNSK